MQINSDGFQKINFALITRLISEGKYFEAEIACCNILDCDQNNSLVFEKLGEIYLLQSKEVEAQIFIERALNIDPENKTAKEKLDALNLKFSTTPENVEQINQLINSKNGKSDHFNSKITPEYEHCWCSGVLKDSVHPLYARCEKCGTHVIKRKYSAEELKKFYGLNTYWHEHQAFVSGHPSIEDRAKTDFNDRIPFWYGLVNKYCAKTDSLLEIGCAHGGFLFYSREQGIKNVVGIEVDEETCKFARHNFRLPHVYSGLFPKVKLPMTSFDVITGFDVIEHFADPISGIKAIADLLDPQYGTFIFQTPCYRGETGNWKQFLPSEHLYLFNEASIKLLFTKCGLDVTDLIPGYFRDDMFVIGRVSKKVIKPVYVNEDTEVLFTETTNDLLQNNNTNQYSFLKPSNRRTIHFVYSGDPHNDNAISAPATITNKLFRYFERDFHVKFYNYDDVDTLIEVEKDDIIIGHPHPGENTMIKRLFSNQASGKFLLWPFHSKLSNITHFVHDLAKQADKLFLISGPYWINTIEFTEYGYLKDKIVRIDNAVDTNVFPLLKTKFNNINERGLFVYGRSGMEKGTTKLFKLLLKIDCPVIIAGRYSVNDISIIKNRPKTQIIGSINLNDRRIVNEILDTCDFFINMSLSDASPTTLFETMAFGLIPITTPQCGYHYPSFILLSHEDIEHNIISVNNALNMDEEQLKLLQKKNLDIVKQIHNWENFLNKIGTGLLQSLNNPKNVQTKMLGIKVAADYESKSNLTQIDVISEFASNITKIILENKPSKIIETGTYLGTGTTKIIASALKELGAKESQFISIEVNGKNYQKAMINTHNAGLNQYVTLVHGLSIPRKMLPTIEKIEKDTVTEMEYDNIFVDHRESERAKLYYNETNFDNVEDSLLEKYLKIFNYQPDFVLLDSGGHIGNLEFNYLIERINKDCIIALDDINHIKHAKSFDQINKDPRFEIINSSNEKFGFCITKFYPYKTDETKSNFAIIVNNILFIRMDSIGDNVLSLQVLEKISKKYPEAQITVACQEHIAELYSSIPFVNKIISVDLKKIKNDSKYESNIRNLISKDHFDLLINPVYSRSSFNEKLISYCNASKKITFAGDTSNISSEELEKSKTRYTDLVDSQNSKMEILRYNDLLEYLDIHENKIEPAIWVSSEDELFADNFFKVNNLNKENTIVLFAGTLRSIRNYEHFGIAINEILKETDFNIIALGAGSEKSINTINIEKITGNVFDLTGKTTIRQAASIIQRSCLAIGSETGLAHIACAAGTPNVIILGGGHFGRFMPYSNLTSIVTLPLDCFGCNWKCKYDETFCINSVDPLLIVKAADEALNKPSKKPRIYFQSVWEKKEPGLSIDKDNQFIDKDSVEIIYEEKGKNDGNFENNKFPTEKISLTNKIIESDFLLSNRII